MGRVKSLKGFQLDNYVEELTRLAKLSRLYSDEEKPFFHYRMVEKAYIRATGSIDVTRKDAAFDAIHPNGYGIGIKTFSAKASDRLKSEKVAEFNKASSRGEFKGLSGLELAKKISEKRNQRIDEAYDSIQFPKDPIPTKKDHIYHLVVRTRGRFLLYELPYEKIDINKISLVPDSRSRLAFTDGKSEYSWNKTKSTLSMKFSLLDPGRTVIAMTMSSEEILKSLEYLAPAPLDPNAIAGRDYWILPLFSPRGSRGTGDKVKPKSGINLRLASEISRKRRPLEFELQIPDDLRRKFPLFLPWSPKATPISNFTLPGGQTVEGKRTGQEGKQLTFGGSDQKTVADWLFSSVSSNQMTLWKKREPFSYSHLEKAGFDSIRIDKFNNGYRLSTAELGTYYRFLEEIQASP